MLESVYRRGVQQVADDLEEAVRRYRTHTTWTKGDEDMLLAAADDAVALLRAKPEVINDD